MAECEPFTQRFAAYEKQIMHFQEILLFKRPLALVLILIYIFSLFGFAYSVEAEFIASLILTFFGVYGAMAFYFYFADKIDAFLFPELENVDPNASNRVRSFEELGQIFDKCRGPRTTTGTQRQLIAAASFTVLGLFFIVVRPFWFNLVVVLLALLLPGILLLPQVNAVLPQKFRCGSSSQPIKPTTEETEQPKSESVPENEPPQEAQETTVPDEHPKEE